MTNERTVAELVKALRQCNDILTALTSGTPDPSGNDIMVHYERCVSAELASRQALALMESNNGTK